MVCLKVSPGSLVIIKNFLMLCFVLLYSNGNLQPKNGVYTVGDFMTKKEELHVVKPTTTVNEGTFYMNLMP